MTEEQSVAGDIQRMVTEDRVPYSVIGAIAGVAPEKLQSYVESSPVGLVEPADGNLSPNEGERLSVLTAQLTAIKEIPDADRVEGMLAALTQTFGFPVDALASLIGVETTSLERLSTSFSDVPAEEQTAIALRLSSVVNAINMASATA